MPPRHWDYNPNEWLPLGGGIILLFFLILNGIFLAEKCPLQCFPGFQPGLYE
jgi:hypothetical protein